MSEDNKSQGGDLFIVDNSDTDWKVKQYLHEWADVAHSFDIATRFSRRNFEEIPENYLNTFA